MKKSNKQTIQMNQIMNEEIARACMIVQAKNVLSENKFNIFITELRDYENNLVITESNQGELLYESFFNRLKNLASGAFKKIAPSDSEKLKKMADELGMIDVELEIASSKSEKIALNAKARALVKQMAEIDPVAAQEAGKLYDMPGSVDKGGAEVPDAAAREKAVDDLFAKGDAATSSARADSALDSIKDAFKKSYVNSMNMNANMYNAGNEGMKALGRYFSQMARGDTPKSKEDDLMVQIMAKLNSMKGMKDMVPSAEEVEASMEKIPDGTAEDGGGDGGTEKKVVSVRSIQRPMINVIQRVAAAQDVDMSVKQAQEIAISITKNLADQMRANGVQFKGDKPASPEDIKESFMKELYSTLNEERFTRPNQLKKLSAQKKNGKAEGVRIGSQWLKVAKELKRKIVPFNMHKEEGFKNSMEESSKEENSMIDFLDLANDLSEMLTSEVLRAARSGASKRREEIDALREILKDTLNLYKKYKILLVKESKKGAILKISLTPEYRRKYIELKKKVKGLDKKGDEKASAADMSMASAQKGKVNISQTVAKAVQAGGLDQGVAKKITPILKKKIQKIIAKHMGADVKYLEEKINRYVLAVIKEVRQNEKII